MLQDGREKEAKRALRHHEAGQRHDAPSPPAFDPESSQELAVTWAPRRRQFGLSSHSYKPGRWAEPYLLHDRLVGPEPGPRQLGLHCETECGTLGSESNSNIAPVARVMLCWPNHSDGLLPFNIVIQHCQSGSLLTNLCAWRGTMTERKDPARWKCKHGRHTKLRWSQ